MENELAQVYETYNPSTNQMAAEGRKGDAMMAHVTPGDYVIPKDILVQHPDFLVKLKKVMADEHEDYRTHMVGSGFENINPETGAAEFGFGRSIKRPIRSVGRTSGELLGKALPRQGDVLAGKAAPYAGAAGGLYFGGPVGGLVGLEFGKGVREGVTNTGNKVGPTTVQAAPQPEIEEMKLPGSLQEMGGLTDVQRRSYLASQGAYGEGLGGSSKDYYANLLQRNIQAGQGNLLPAESQYLSQQGVNTNLSGQELINALRGF